MNRRDRYFDTLRAVAIMRVVLFHAFPIAALELVFPSMGVMFALGGSLMVKSLDRNAAKAVRNRIRRLLPSLWVMGLILVPMMIHRAWTDQPSWRLLLWVVPIADPPSSEFGYAAAGVLWYLVTYLWLVLLSPVLLFLYRRGRLLTVLMPLAGLTLFVTFPGTFGQTVGTVLQNVLAYGSCWVLGMAHREGDLAKLKPALMWALAVACVGGGLGWAITHPGENGMDLVSLPLAYAAYSTGFVLILLRWAPRMDWLARTRPLDGFVSMLNNRAVTIYLWHNVAITLAIFYAYGPWQLWRIPSQALQEVTIFGIAMCMLLGAVLALGWVEDVAARRPARVSPFVKRQEYPQSVASVPVQVPAQATLDATAPDQFGHERFGHEQFGHEQFGHGQAAQDQFAHGQAAHDQFAHGQATHDQFARDQFGQYQAAQDQFGHGQAAHGQFAQGQAAHNQFAHGQAPHDQFAREQGVHEQAAPVWPAQDDSFGASRPVYDPPGATRSH